MLHNLNGTVLNFSSRLIVQYQIGQAYSFSVESLNNTGGGEGIEVLRAEQFENLPLFNGKPHNGTYTNKIYHMGR